MVRGWVCALSFFSCMKIGYQKLMAEAEVNITSVQTKDTDANLWERHGYKVFFCTNCHWKKSLLRGSESSGKLLWAALLPDNFEMPLLQGQTFCVSCWKWRAHGFQMMPFRHASFDIGSEKSVNVNVFLARNETQISQTQLPVLAGGPGSLWPQDLGGFWSSPASSATRGHAEHPSG